MINNEEREETIDLAKLAGVVKRHKKPVAGIIIGCTVIAIVISLLLPKQWESTTLVQTRSAGKGGMAAADAAMGFNIGGSSSPSTDSYIELMKSRTVLNPIIDSMEWEDEKKKPDAEAFAKKYLKIENTKKTNLITVKATGKSPEEAQMISQAVVDNFLAMETDMNKETQSMLIKFLDERLVTAKQESDEAAQKLADFSKDRKVYSPEDQAKLALEQLAAYDKAISEMQAKQKSAQAQYDVATNKLGEQKSGAKAYNINDNSTVQSIRAQIVQKEVELVGLEQRYTDNHPSVITAREQLNELQNSLSEEVNAAVDSNAATLNPAQAELLKSQALAQAEASAASASETALQEKRDAKETAMGDFPDDVMTYMQLKRDSMIKDAVYQNLVKESEKDKIQEAMESMDIQIIDPANLPREDRPAAPRKKLIAAIGFVIGCLGAFGYSLVKYKKEEA